MSPYDSAASSAASSSSVSSSATKPHESTMAPSLERLETAMVNSPAYISQHVSDAVHYNPSDSASWVDSIFSELHQTFELPDFSYFVAPSPLDETAVHSHWSDNGYNHTNQNIAGNQVVVAAMEEDASIKLVHTLLTWAEYVERGELALAGSLVMDMQSLLTGVTADCGIGKVAGCFIAALSRRIFSSPSAMSSVPAYENEVLYHHFFEPCPYLMLRPTAQFFVKVDSPASSFWRCSPFSLNFFSATDSVREESILTASGFPSLLL